MSENVIYRSVSDDGVIEITQNQQQRSLYLGSDAKQSSMDLRQPHRLVLSYTRAMVSCLLFNPEPQNILLIGLGGGSLARFMLHYFPACHIDAVELRPEVVKLAHGYFALPDPHPRLTVFPLEAQRFLAEHHNGQAPYDLILVDAFNHDGVADTVKTAQFMQACQRQLTQNGIFTVNLWDHPVQNSGHTIALIEQTFTNNLLTLPVADKGNLIVHAARTQQTLQLSSRKATARSLEQSTATEFSLMLRTLKRSNRWRRLSRIMASWA